MTIPKINLEPDNVYKSKLHRKAMNSYILIMIISAIGLSSYATAQDDLARQPIIANAQSLTSLESPPPKSDQNVDPIPTVESKEKEPTKEVKNDSLLSSQDNYTRIYNYISKYNQEEAESMSKACLKMSSFDVCRLSLAIAVKESRLSQAYTIASMNARKGLVWQGRSAGDIANIVESDNQELAIRFNLWGVKYSGDRGGNYIQYVDISNNKTYFGSIIGYKSWDDAFTDHNRILTQTYGKFTNDEIKRSDIEGISVRYLTGNKKAWVDTVFKQFNQI